MLINHIILSLLLIAAIHARATADLPSLLQSKGTQLFQQARMDGSDARSTYIRFVDLVATELGRSGDKATAAALTRSMLDPYGPDFPRDAFAWVTHTFAREYYKDDIIRETAALVRFKTYATDVPNRENPEFIRQKDYLRQLAQKLGLNFNDVGGYVQEIWIGEGKESFGIMAHSDVQPVELNEWSRDPWSGEIVDGKIWGRGSVDDKGPIVAVMYGMRALLDTGLPLQRRIVLLVGTDEESANEDVASYLQVKNAPDQTIVVDSNYPVICAEKGWCGVWLELPKGSLRPSGDGLEVVHIQSGFSPSIVPERAIAKLVIHGGSVSDAKVDIERKIEVFKKRRKDSRIQVGLEGDTLHLTATGKSVHSSAPARGHNALMDLLVFIHKDLKPLLNDHALMAKFAADYIGFELNGQSLGIAYADPFMGDVTVAANIYQKTDSTVMLMFNFRVPRGIERTRIEEALQSRFDAFSRNHGVKLLDTRYLSDAHIIDPQGPFVQKLLGIYNSVTGESRTPESIGGGTYAKRLPNAVVFGPALPDEEYLGHEPDEFFLISTLMRNVEILTHTMVEFGM